jgi:hypothetical protein
MRPTVRQQGASPVPEGTAGEEVLHIKGLGRAEAAPGVGAGATEDERGRGEESGRPRRLRRWPVATRQRGATNVAPTAHCSLLFVQRLNLCMPHQALVEGCIARGVNAGPSQRSAPCVWVPDLHTIWRMHLCSSVLPHNCNAALEDQAGGTAT